LETEKEIIRLNSEKEIKSKEYTDFIDTHDKKIDDLLKRKELLLMNIYADKIEIGQSLLYVKVSARGFSDLINLAIKDLASGCNYMKNQYYGAKDYGGFSGQREDHRYGYGPRHGHIVFALGIKEPSRKLTKYEIDCCLYYLCNFFTVHENVLYATTK